jgi:hypothetical protein
MLPNTAICSNMDVFPCVMRHAWFIVRRPSSIVPTYDV